VEHTGSLLAAGLAVTEVEAEAVAKKLGVDSPKQQKLQGDCPHTLGCRVSDTLLDGNMTHPGGMALVLTAE
jgi:hypothetical protein